MRFFVRFLFLPKIILGLLLLFVAEKFLLTDAVAEDQWRGWSYVEWDALKLGDGWFDVSQENRTYENFHQPSYSDTKLRFNYKVNSWLTVAAAESYIRSRTATGHTNESRPSLELRPHYDGDYAQLEYRPRLEMREVFGDDRGTLWTIRQRLQVAGSKDYFGAVQPIINDEVFCNLTNGEWDQNRFFVGVRYEIVPGVELQPMLGIQSYEHGDHWDSPHIALLSLKFNLPVL